VLCGAIDHDHYSDSKVDYSILIGGREVSLTRANVKKLVDKLCPIKVRIFLQELKDFEEIFM
jgi:hypothetical protein